MYGRETFYAVLRSTVDTDDSAQTGTAVTVARCLSTPRRAVEIGLSVVHNADDGVVVVQYFRSFDILHPERRVGTLARTALGGKRVGLVAVENAGGVYEHCLMVTARESEDEHQGIVQAEGTHRPVAVQSTAALAEVLVGNEQAAITAEDVADNVLVASIGQLIYKCIAVTGIKLSDKLLLLRGSQRVVDGEREEIILCFFIGLEVVERRQ